MKVHFLGWAACAIALPACLEPPETTTSTTPVAVKLKETGPASQPTAELLPPPARETPPPMMAAAPSHENPAPPPQNPTPPPTPPPAPVEAPAPVNPPEVNVVYFGSGKADLSDGDKVTLTQLVDYLQHSPEDKVWLYAFADPTGTRKLNFNVMKKRAATVQKFLGDAGVPATRVEIPNNALQFAPKSFPKDSYWRLRKVMVKFSEAALAKVDVAEKKAEAEADSDAKPTPTAAQASAQASGPKLEKIDVVYWRSVNHSLFLIAKAKGYFEDEGFDVRLREASNLEANQVTEQLAEGVGTVRIPISAMDVTKRKYFMGAVCPYGFHEAVSKNIPLVQIGGMLENPNTMVMKKELADSVKQNLKAFSGHTVARLKDAPSYIDYTLLFTNVLKAQKIPFTEKWYKGHAEMEAALVRGEVDAVQSLPPYDQEMANRHAELGIFELRSIYPTMPCCRQLVTRDQLRDKKMRDKYVRFERAVIRAHKYYQENKAEAAELVARLLHMKSSEIRQVYMRKGYSLDPNPNLKGSMAFYNTMKGSIGKQDVRETVDSSVYEEALLGLAKTNPKDEYFSRAIQEYKLTN